MKLTVAKKMALLAATALLGIVLLAGLGQYQMSKVYESANYGNINSVPSILIMDRMSADFGDVRLATAKHMLNTDSAKIAEIDADIKKSRERLEKDQIGRASCRERV